jgi:hypothetical protein
MTMKRQRSGQRLAKKRWALLIFITVVLVLGVFSLTHGIQQTGQNSYVGSLACKECHPEEYSNFMTYAKKSISFQSIKRQMRHLTPEEIKQCYPCHTTGYGQTGGFVSLEETPHLKNAGCEVCHGPGAEHAQTGDTATIIGKMTKKDCEICHISERVKAFKYKPLIHGGAH